MKWIDNLHCRILRKVFVPLLGDIASLVSQAISISIRVQLVLANTIFITSMNSILNVLMLININSQQTVSPFPRLIEVSQHNTTIASNSLVRLSSIEIRLRLRNLPNWTTDGEALFYTRTFEDFVEAISFINSLIEPAEQLNHHPDIRIKYNQVSLELTTHDAQGLTDLDFQLAQRISQL